MRAVADDRELVRKRRVDARVVAGVRAEPDAERGQKLRVGDVLDLRADDAPRDLEARVRGKRARKFGDDAIVLPSEQRVNRRQRDVLVRADVSGHDRVGRLRRQRPHEVHRGRRHRASRVGAWEVAVRRQQQRRAAAQPVEPSLRDAVDVRRVDVAADRVDLLPGNDSAGPGRCRRAREVDRQVALELLETIVAVESDRRTLRGRLVAEAEIVIEKLAPGPAPLRDAVLREQVLADVVEDTVADVSRRRSADHAGDAVGVHGSRDAQERHTRLSPRVMRDVVSVAVQRAPRGPRARRCGRRREEDEQCNSDQGSAHRLRLPDGYGPAALPHVGALPESPCPWTACLLAGSHPSIARSL